MNQTVMDNKEFQAIQKFLTAFKEYMVEPMEWNGVLDTHRDLLIVVKELGTQARVKV